MGFVREIQQRKWRDRLSQLVDAVAHAIKMDTAVAESLRDGLLNHGGWVLVMQFEHLHEFFHAPSFGPFLL